MGPHPAVAAVRSAVRRSLADVDPGSVVLVACSGGSDSCALAAATAFEASRAGWTTAAVTVDHGLQPGSDEQAARVAAFLRGLGFDPVEVAAVSVGGPGGPEAAAREARYAALDDAATRLGAAVVLLGHTRDDQAETVLLGLARGSGARSLSGMPERARRGLYRRPLLGLDRSVTRAACAALDLAVWDDPHNADPAYARVRVRREVLPVLERELGPGISAALARTAELLRDDADALDAWADRAYAECVVTSTAEENAGTAAMARVSGVSGGIPGSGHPRTGPAATGTSGSGASGAGASGNGTSGNGGRQRTTDLPVLHVDRLEAVPPAVRRRVIRRAALWSGCPGTDLSAGHLTALEALVVDWRGQAWVDLPGGVRARRRGGLIQFSSGTTPLSSGSTQP